MTTKRILVIDDNPLDRKIAADVLTHGGFEVEQAGDGRAGLQFLYAWRPNLVLLDVMMPGLDGWTVCERVRELSDLPIIMVTSLNREEEMIRGLEMGADDFVSKPISPASLLARVRAVLRRAGDSTRPDSSEVLEAGSLRIDPREHAVLLDGVRLELTPTEYRLLYALASSPGLHAYSSLLMEVWGPEYADDIDFLRVYVWRLRKKLEKDAGAPPVIANERGFGYRLVGTGTSAARTGLAGIE